MTDMFYPSDPPAMRIENTWIHISLGETAVLKCQVTANPVPKVNKFVETQVWIFNNLLQVVWYKDTMKLIETSRLHILNVGATYEMTILNVRRDDWGQYYCGASNKLGEVSVKVTLTGAPAKPDILPLKCTPQLYSLDLVGQVISRYPPTVHEVKAGNNSQAHTKDTKYSLTRQIHSSLNTVTYSLNGLHPSTLYGVTVTTKNRWGWSPVSDINTFLTLDKGNIIIPYSLYIYIFIYSRFYYF